MGKQPVRSTLRVSEVVRPASRVKPLGVRLDAVQAKIREDLIRFRTCCADPRASK